MFGTIGGPELLLILVIALIVFGPRKLPDIGKSVGRMMAEFKKASNDFKKTIEDEVEAEKLKDALTIKPEDLSATTSPEGMPEAVPTPDLEAGAPAPPTEPQSPADPDEKVVSRSNAPPVEVE